MLVGKLRYVLIGGTAEGTSGDLLLIDQLIVELSTKVAV